MFGPGTTGTTGTTGSAGKASANGTAAPKKGKAGATDAAGTAALKKGKTGTTGAAGTAARTCLNLTEGSDLKIPVLILIFAKLTAMTSSNKFEDLIIWQDAIKLAKEVFTMFENCRNFSVRNQIERAVVSISANIAEGYELDTNKQLLKHLFISRASCGEVRSLLCLAKELRLFSEDRINVLIEFSSRRSIMIWKFIRSRKD